METIPAAPMEIAVFASACSHATRNAAEAHKDSIPHSVSVVQVVYFQRRSRSILGLCFLWLALVGASCSTMFQQNDPVRLALYTAKKAYLLAREQAIINHSRGLLSQAKFDQFKTADRKVEAKHNELVDLYLQAKPLTEKMLADLKTLVAEAQSLKGGSP